MTHQTYFEPWKDHAQADMLAEFAGQDGQKLYLIDVEKERARLANKPLDGQAHYRKMSAR